MLGSMPLIGEPAYTPPRPAERPAFPAVGEAGSSRSTKLMTPAERAKLEADLAAARANSVQERRNQISAPDD